MRSDSLFANYDPSSDVLYVTLGKAQPSESEERPGGLLFRYAIPTDAPAGVTVLRFARWRGREHDLAKEMSDFLHVSTARVNSAIHDATEPRSRRA